MSSELIDVKANETKRQARKKAKEPVESQQILSRLLSFGLTNKQAQKMISSFDEDYINQNLEIVEKRCRAGKVAKVPAYTMMALKEDYRPKKTFLEEEKEVEAKEAQAVREQKRRLEAFEKIKIELEASRLESALEKLTAQERKTLESDFLESMRENKNGAMVLKYHKKKGLGSIVVRSVFNVFAKEKLIKAQVTQKELKAFIKTKGYKIGDFKQELEKAGE
ncbi:MAG: hypothetical protein GY797_01210 [Deltaproteobacteria bacterium]|nr:hypothetical protein [Deltaproteobacteria bacterium]